MQIDLTVTDEQRMKELFDLKGHPEYEVHRRRQTLMAKLARHSPKRRKLGITAVRDSDGSPVYGKSEAKKNWQDIGETNFNRNPLIVLRPSSLCSSGLYAFRR